MYRSFQSIILTIAAAGALALSVESCVDHNLAPGVVVDCTGAKTVSYVNDIIPIINSHCAITGDGGCHNGGNGDDLNWTKLANLQNHASNLKIRVTLPPTDPAHMPRIGTLDLDQIQTLVCWVEQGAKNN